MKLGDIHLLTYVNEAQCGTSVYFLAGGGRGNALFFIDDFFFPVLYYEKFQEVVRIVW